MSSQVHRGAVADGAGEGSVRSRRGSESSRAERRALEGSAAAAPAPPRSRDTLRQFERPDAARALWQVATSFVPYVATMALMHLMMRQGLPWWTTLPLAVLAAGFMVRLFILMHDCIHSSFLRSRRAERFLGRILGVLVFTPFGEWGQSHLGHHATSGDLDRRGIGDVWTLTVREYAAASGAKRFQYRVTRNPFLMLLFGPFLVFLIGNRIPPRRATRQRVMSVVYTDLGIAAIVVTAALTVGLEAYLLIQLPVLFFGGAWGIWLFYVQHQFEGSYWSRHGEWNPLQAALQGSSYYKLPKVLQWFSGSIGLHHVHHLRPRIPSYNLQRCLDATPDLWIPPLTLSGSLKCARLALWDERAREFVSFRAASCG
jgi:omega-6 fatty acid desaturase (delta-12 desaturase)